MLALNKWPLFSPVPAIRAERKQGQRIDHLNSYTSVYKDLCLQSESIYITKGSYSMQ